MKSALWHMSGNVIKYISSWVGKQEAQLPTRPQDTHPFASPICIQTKRTWGNPFPASKHLLYFRWESAIPIDISSMHVYWWAL